MTGRHQRVVVWRRDSPPSPSLPGRGETKAPNPSPGVLPLNPETLRSGEADGSPGTGHGEGGNEAVMTSNRLRPAAPRRARRREGGTLTERSSEEPNEGRSSRKTVSLPSGSGGSFRGTALPPDRSEWNCSSGSDPKPPGAIKPVSSEPMVLFAPRRTVNCNELWRICPQARRGGRGTNVNRSTNQHDE